MITVDFINKISIDEHSSRNELSALSSLFAGLNQLYTVTKGYESDVATYEKAHGGKLEFSMLGGTPGLPPGADKLLPCLFHWFGISMINYASLVGFLDGITTKVFSRENLEDKKYHAMVKKHCGDYVDSISELEPVKILRNKVAAHFAITDPHKNDNPAFLDFSVMPSVGYDTDRFRAGIFVFSRTDSAGVTHEAKLPPWSLTEVFESIAPRYWRRHAS